MIVRLHISRDSYYYVSKLIFPLLTLAGMSFYSFALDVEDLKSKLNFIAIIMLSNMSMIHIIAGTVPKGLHGTIDRVVMLQLVALFCNGGMHAVVKNSVHVETVQYVLFITMVCVFGAILGIL